MTTQTTINTGSSSGRTPDFDSGNTGSNPEPVTKPQTTIESCPFCPTMMKPEIIQVGIPFVMESFCVRCTFCGSNGPTCSDKKRAVNMWNNTLIDLRKKEIAKEPKTTPEEGLKPKLVEWLKEHHAKIDIEHRPKQRSIYTISFDQGVFQGSNVYTVRYDRLTPLFLAQICFSEGWNNTRKIDAAILKALEITP